MGSEMCIRDRVIGGAGYALGQLMNMDDVKALGPVKILMKTYKVYQQTIKMMDKVKNVISGKTLFTKFGKQVLYHNNNNVTSDIYTIIKTICQFKQILWA